jgi:aryl-alcohol dehydrogenase-like predicted oxidoreductase
MGVGVLPYSPLARGLLAGTRERGGRTHTVRAASAGPDRPADFDVLDAVRTVASERKLSAATIALAWLAHRPGVVAPILGATAPEHLDAAVNALSIELSEDENAVLEQPYLPRLITDYS